jgi:hypothetical protein
MVEDFVNGLFSELFLTSIPTPSDTLDVADHLLFIGTVN